MNALAALASDGPAAETVTPGVLGFISIAAVGVALYFLMKSMRRRLDGIQVDRDPDPADPDTGTAESAETPDTPSAPAPESPDRSSSSS